jgi:hypothetical protein
MHVANAAHAQQGEQEAFVRDTLWGAAAVSGVALIGLAIWGRWSWTFGFAIGALISAVNFRLIAGAVSGVVGSGGAQPGATLWKGSLFRFAISGAVLVAAVTVLRVSLPALAAGLLFTQVTMVVIWLTRALRALR